MRTEQFEEVINNRIETCKSVLCSKAEEYATDDRLHNFKVAGELQKCTAVKALGLSLIHIQMCIRDRDSGIDG